MHMGDGNKFLNLSIELIQVISLGVLLHVIFVAAIGVNFFMQASWNDVVMYYILEVYKEVGIKVEKQLFGVTIVIGISKTCFILISTLFLDQDGRRPMLLLGSCSMAISLFVLGLGCTLLKLCGDNKDQWVIALWVVG